ncbi:uncharacterized protein LOC110061616 [Paramuricea clavata]|uniref:Uncharacterized protein LOC110061616 n=1 Tax=Paramuricea clavata TaxID=317549 RepID=A0A7D9HRD8_PARCT|nr:uncharacterized protein LOC110061616 [Paramuricea clavata]
MNDFLDRVCEQCDKEDSSLYCCECELNYCESCSTRFHSKVGDFVPIYWRESDEDFRKQFTAERSRQFDICEATENLMNVKVPSLSERYRIYTDENYSVKPKDGRILNHAIEEHTRLLKKVEEKLEQVKNHDTEKETSSNMLSTQVRSKAWKT